MTNDPSSSDDTSHDDSSASQRHPRRHLAPLPFGVRLLVLIVGGILILVGIMLQAGLSLATVKLAAILLFLLLTSPTASNALASAALLAGTRPGAPLPEETLRRWEDATGCFILEGYGQTEAGPVLTYNPAIGIRKPASVGVPLEMTEVEIVEVDGGDRPLPAGNVGEIRTRGPQIMAGYRNLPGETAETLRDGWLYTGDIGEFDEDGYLFIRDRKKDMAIVGGYNVFPREIDEVLYAHPDILEAAAVGVPDDHYGEVIMAWVTLNAGSSVTEAALIAYCESQLARYKVPKSIIIGDEIPKTTVGKIDKKALR